MTASVVLLAAGKGKRFSSSRPKVLAAVGGKPVFLHSLLTFMRYPGIREVILVAGKGSFPGLKAALSRLHFRKPLKIVFGGKERQDSVRRGLAHVSASSDIVLIHDAARPFISRALVERVMKQAALHGAAVPGVPLKYTIKEVSGVRGAGNGYCGRVAATPDRERFCEVQTPQAFRRRLILAAYAGMPEGKLFTDDASLVEAMGRTVRVAAGEYTNIKITTRSDLELAAAAAGARRS